MLFIYLFITVTPLNMKNKTDKYHKFLYFFVFFTSTFIYVWENTQHSANDIYIRTLASFILATFIGSASAFLTFGFFKVINHILNKKIKVNQQFTSIISLLFIYSILYILYILFIKYI